MQFYEKRKKKIQWKIEQKIVKNIQVNNITHYFMINHISNSLLRF